VPDSDDARDIFTQSDESEPDEESQPDSAKKWKTIIIIAAAAVVVLATLLTVILFSVGRGSETTPTGTTVSHTMQTTRDRSHDKWMQTFLGDWVDEQSTGKSNIPRQGGGQLNVIAVANDTVTFDLISYSGGDDLKVAAITGAKAALSGDTATFSFADDSMHHSGHGTMTFLEGHIDVLVELEGVPTDANGVQQADDHSLAINVRFSRAALPESSGYDIRRFETLADVQAVAGNPTADPQENKDGTTTYTFDNLRVLIRKDGSISQLYVKFSKVTAAIDYCYDRIDGTMNYDVVKTYFGEAEQDYTEQPTNIRVLHYIVDVTKSVTFTFNAEDDLLVSVRYNR
ncbi:MAG: hypothetical protein IJU16_05255, partial [Clostridia bacterium]|nr:hypothetical protein [Clostridia bacterium]